MKRSGERLEFNIPLEDAGLSLRIMSNFKFEGLLIKGQVGSLTSCRALWGGNTVPLINIDLQFIRRCFE